MPYDFKWLNDTIRPFATGALIPVVLVIAIDFGSYILKNEQDAIRNLSATNCNTNDVGFNCKTEPHKRYKCLN